MEKTDGKESVKSKKMKKETLFSTRQILLIIGIMIAVIVFTYLIFTSRGCGVPADRILSKQALEKSDWLVFWGSILAVICTLSLALVSYRQNKDLHKANDDREKKDTFFAKLRFAAEFYSWIDFTSLSIEELENENVMLTFDISETGKAPISAIDFSHIGIRISENIQQLSRSKSSYISTHFNIDEFDQIDMIIKRSKEQAIQRSTISFNISSVQYRSLNDLIDIIIWYNDENEDRNIFDETILIARLEYSLENPLQVKTKVSCNISLTLDSNNSYTIRDNKKYVFSIHDISNEMILYDYIGEIR